MDYLRSSQREQVSIRWLPHSLVTWTKSRQMLSSGSLKTMASPRICYCAQLGQLAMVIAVDGDGSFNMTHRVKDRCNKKSPAVTRSM
jgi:thiamine pyrophosphate-dependent acetolactate synthase large subunit-like protein